MSWFFALTSLAKAAGPLCAVEIIRRASEQSLMFCFGSNVTARTELDVFALLCALLMVLMQFIVVKYSVQTPCDFMTAICADGQLLLTKPDCCSRTFVSSFLGIVASALFMRVLRACADSAGSSARASSGLKESLLDKNSKSRNRDERSSLLF